MKNKVVKAICVILAVVLAGGSLAACGDTDPIDGSQTVLVINGEEIPYGELNFFIRYQQAQTYYYMVSLGLSSGSMWNSDYTYDPSELTVTSESSETDETSDTSESSADSTSETSDTSESSADSTSEISDTSEEATEEVTTSYGEYFKEMLIISFTELVVTRQMAIEEYDVELTEDDYAQIEEAAAEFMETNEDAEEMFGVTAEMLEDLLSLYAYDTVLKPYATEDVDREVSDEEAAQTTIIYVRLAKNSDSEDAEAEEDEDTKTNAELLEDAEEALALLLEAGEFDSDEATEIADSVNEDFFSMEYSFGADDEVFPDELYEAFDTLEDGEVYEEVIDTDDFYYIVRMVANFDEEETEAEKESIIAERESEAYTALKEQWSAEATVERMDCLEEITLTDQEVYSILSTTSTTSDTSEDSTSETSEDSSSETTSETSTESTSETSEESSSDSTSETSEESSSETTSETSEESSSETSEDSISETDAAS